jgi:glycine cleavage system H lipoate-binding protein
MSAAREGAPDYLEAVVGYRAWHVADDGLLRPWTFTALPWEPGVNRAVCARDHRHRPPVGDCMCGLYALTDPGDRRLDFRADQAVGAIAAWGDLEVHRTGFRASEACIVALTLPARVGVDRQDRLERAAARYGVPLVPAADLSAEALRHGAPLADDLWEPAWPAPRRAPVRRDALPAVDPAGFAAAARGIALDAHLWVETALGSVVVGLTRALAGGLGDDARLVLPEPGVALEAGDHAATVTGRDGAFGVWAPVGGSVLAVNPRLADDPGLLARDPEGAGWLLRLAPRDWAGEAANVTWGTGAARHYAACVARDAARGDAFADVRLERLRALPPVRSAADVLAALRAERAAPRFADAAAVHEQLGGRLRDALAEDPALRAHLGRLDQIVTFALTDPAAQLVLDLRGDARVVAWQHPGSDPSRCVELACSAEDAYRWFTGGLDAAGAVRRGELRCSAGPAAALRALAVLKHLRVPAWEPAPSWAR